MEHYGLRSTRIQEGEAHENGVAEKNNDLVKRAVAQALVLRGSRDFESLEAYEGWLQQLVERRLNRPRADKVAVGREHLRPLPTCRVPDYTRYHPTVRRWARVLIERWRQHYNRVRPHSSLGYRPPAPEATLLKPPTLRFAGLNNLLSAPSY